MLTIRMQRTGRKGHAQFRVVVQDSRQSPTSGKVVALVGNYDPHTKTANLTKDKIELYLKNGAQPSDRAALLFKKEGIKLPKWVSVDTKKQAKTRHPEKFVKVQPKEAPAEEAKPEETNDAATEEVSEPTEAPVETAKAEALSSEEIPVEPPAEEPAAETESTEAPAEADAEATDAK